MRRAGGHTAVMAGRREPPDSLDFFPTPPWATRALLEHVIGDAGRNAYAVAWEPAAGEGHMAAVLGDRFADVYRTDVHDYGGLDAVGSFVGEGPDVVKSPFPGPDWIITNPPFNLAVAFAERALAEAVEGVALLLRTSWLEGAERYDRLFRDTPPSIVAPFVERVAIGLYPHTGHFSPLTLPVPRHAGQIGHGAVVSVPLILSSSLRSQVTAAAPPPARRTADSRRR